jgi:hypothetical protein
MANTVKIGDGDGGGQIAKVVNGGALLTQNVPFPPLGEIEQMKIYNEYLTLNGDGTTFDMRVDGSVTEQEFSINAENDNDIYISSLSFVIADSGAALNLFGAITALANGCVLSYQDETGEDIIISDTLVSNWEFVRLCNGNPPFGSGNNTFRANNVVGTSEGFLPFLDLKQVFGFQWGIKLRANTLQKFKLTVRDDVTGVDAFNVIAKGFRRSRTE